MKSKADVITEPAAVLQEFLASSRGADPGGFDSCVGASALIDRLFGQSGPRPGASPEVGARERPFRLPVQHVGSLERRVVFAGTVASGSVCRGDRVRVFPSGRSSTIARVATSRGDVDGAVAGENVAVALADDLGDRTVDMIAGAECPPQTADQFEATIVWTGDEPLLQGRSYLLRVGTRVVSATVAPLKYKIAPDTLDHLPAERLFRDEVAVCELELDRRIAFDPYSENRTTGSFELVDGLTKVTVGAGFLHFALRRSDNVHWQAVDVNKGSRAALKRHRPCVVWLTGLSGSGKSTIANVVESKLYARGCHTYLLDGDNVRHGLTKDLGFTDADRVENIRRVAEVARLMVDAGLIVLVAFISPFASERRMARALLEEREFFEVHVDTPLEVAEGRDPKGLYRKARRGELRNFTGIDSPYEAPESPEIRVDTSRLDPSAAADEIIGTLEAAGVLAPERS
jgi:bifunctional enzyme CysN/CysC